MRLRWSTTRARPTETTFGWKGRVASCAPGVLTLGWLAWSGGVGGLVLVGVPFVLPVIVWVGRCGAPLAVSTS